MFNLYNKVTASKLNDQLSKQKETQKKFLSFILTDPSWSTWPEYINPKHQSPRQTSILTTVKPFNEAKM